MKHVKILLNIHVYIIYVHIPASLNRKTYIGLPILNILVCKPIMCIQINADGYVYLYNVFQCIPILE